MDKVTRQCPQTTTFLKRKESRSGIEPRSFRLPARPNRLTSCLLQTYSHLSANEKLSVFGDIWRNQVWQRLEEGCRKPVLGVWRRPWSVSVSAMSDSSTGCEDGLNDFRK